MTNLLLLQNLENGHSTTKALTLFDCFIHSILQNCMSGEFQIIRAESQKESKDAQYYNFENDTIFVFSSGIVRHYDAILLYSIFNLTNIFDIVIPQ